jgi:hypothetical protein
MRRFLILIVVLVLLAVAVDRAAWWFAQRAIAEQIQTEGNLAAPPEVSVDGFPFLTQVLRGRYQQIDVDLRNPAVDGGLEIDTLDVRLRGVQVSTRDVLNRNVDSVPVDSAAAVATVSFASLNAAAKENLPDTRSEVKFGPGAGEALKITGAYRAGTLNARLDLEARLVAEDGDLVVKVPTEALDGLPSALRSQIRSLVAQASRLPSLPYGFQARSVTVDSTGVTVQATSSALELSR